MTFAVSGLIYKILIDPVLSKLHRSVLDNIDSSHRVLDVACGTGSLSLAMAEKAFSVTGIDLSEEMISTALRSAGKKGIKNVRFELRDATDLSDIKDKEYDVAVTSMAIHQFDAALAVAILSEMKRIAPRVIIVDYNYPMPKGFSGCIASSIEKIAGGDHYRNFRTYMNSGGVHHFTGCSGLTIISESVMGNGVFLISVC